MNNIPDVRTEENWHTLDDGEKIYTKTWKVRARSHNTSDSTFPREVADGQKRVSRLLVNPTPE